MLYWRVDVKSVVVLVGPTASGKTRISIELAKSLNGEIVSADSMQVYKYMDIGTAKPDKDEMSGIKHHMIDEIYPDEEFSVAKYQQRALKAIEDIIKEDKIPIVTGGTGLYINSLIYNISFSETVCDWDLRESLKKEALEKGNEFLHNRLKEIDPKAAQRIHLNDLKRIIRALEVYQITEKPISHHIDVSRENPPKFNYILLGLRMERERLYERINKRVDNMLKNGLIDEVKKLIEMGYDKNTFAMQGLGYKEVISHLKGEISIDEMVYLLKRDTRHYAKRQITWFKRNENIFLLDVDEITSASEVAKKIKYYIASFGII
jgi:tRNA dimethylallyltransferase